MIVWYVLWIGRRMSVKNVCLHSGVQVVRSTAI